MKRKVIFVSIISMMLLSSCQNPFTVTVSSEQASSPASSIEVSSSSTTPSSSQVTNPSSDAGSSQTVSSIDASSSASISTDSSNADSNLSSVATSSSAEASSSSAAPGTYDPLSINILTLGNQYAGASIYIKAGDKDILIDAGSRHSSSPVIENYVDTHGCTDNSLEYLILTHGDQDHVEGMTTSGSYTGILDYYSIGTIIDNQYSTKTTVGYTGYTSKRDTLVSSGNTVHHTADYYFSLDSGTNQYEANSYNHIELTPTISMDILYNYYYFNTSSDENNYSVSVMLNQGTNRFLLTGDLEEGGETKMVQYYASRGGLPHVKFFKAGHHGSYTASNNVLLNQVTPEMCAVSCVAGSEEYTFNTDNQFPSQAFITRIAAHTSKVFVTSISKYGTDGYPTSGSRVDMNGNIVCSADSSGNVTMTGSNNSISLKDSDWMKSTISRSTSYYDSSTKKTSRVDAGTGHPRTWPSVTSTYN